MVLLITTQGKTGFTGSDTRACRGKLSSGRRTPAMPSTTLVCPAADTPTLGVLMRPRVVSTASTAPWALRTMPVTSQFSRMSTPSRSAARA